MFLHVLNPKTNEVVHRENGYDLETAKAIMASSPCHAVLLSDDPRKTQNVTTLYAFDGSWHEFK